MSRTYGKAQDLIDFTRASSGTALRRVKYGAELVTNGTFDTDTTGWTEARCTAAVVSGQVVLTSTGANPLLNQTLNLTVGKVYKVEGDIIGGTGTAVPQINVQDNNFSSYGALTSSGSFVFVATTTNNYLQLRNQGSTVGDTGTYDNISVKEVTFDTSDGDLVLFNHPANIPRIEYDANGNVLGLLVEESRTNLIPYSDLSTLWSLSNCTKTVNYATSPDGQSNATLFQATSNAQAYLIQSISKAASQIHYSLSVYVKKTNARYASLRIQGLYPSRADVIFDLDTGLVHTSATTVLNFSNASESITPVGGGWYRISISALSDTATLITSVIAFSQNPIFVDGTETASDSSGLMHNIQLEAGSFPTSAIPTSGSTATRSADVASLSTSAFGYNGNEGTFFVEYQRQYEEPAGGTFPKIIHVDDGTGNNRIFAQGVPSSVNMTIATYSGGASTSLSPAVAFASSNKIAISVDSEASFKFVINGSASGSIATNIVDLSLLTSVSIGLNLLGPSQQVNGHIKALKYIPRELIDSQLEALTA